MGGGAWMDWRDLMRLLRWGFAAISHACFGACVSFAGFGLVGAEAPPTNPASGGLSRSDGLAWMGCAAIWHARFGGCVSSAGFGLIGAEAPPTNPASV